MPASRYQGLLARNLLYPMSRAVFGQRIREMYSEEWGFSGRLATQCLSQNVWNDEAVRARPEAWMAVTAICFGDEVLPVFSGTEGCLRPRAPGPIFVEAIRQTVGSLFWCLENVSGALAGPHGIGGCADLRTGPRPDADGKRLRIRKRFLNCSERASRNWNTVLRIILTHETHAQIQRDCRARTR